MYQIKLSTASKLNYPDLLRWVSILHLRWIDFKQNCNVFFSEQNEYIDTPISYAQNCQSGYSGCDQMNLRIGGGAVNPRPISRGGRSITSRWTARWSWISLLDFVVLRDATLFAIAVNLLGPVHIGVLSVLKRPEPHRLRLGSSMFTWGSSC